MAVLKVKMNNEWVPVAGGSSGSSELYQSLTSNSGDYPVILADSTTLSSSSSSTVNKTSSLKYNPSSQVLTAPTFQGGLTTNLLFFNFQVLQRLSASSQWVND